MNEQPEPWQTINQTDRMQPTITPEYLASQGLSPSTPERFWRYVNKNGPVPPHKPELGPCWLWMAGKTPKDYGKLSISRGCWCLAHRVSWILHCGEIKDCILHKCDNPPCVNPTHLWDGSKLENTQDMFAKGRQIDRSMGKCGNAKLTPDQVRQIRHLYETGQNTRQELNLMFNHSNVYEIINRKLWRSVV